MRAHRGEGLREVLRVLLAAAMFACGHASADSWQPPRTETYVSEGGEWRLTVVPRGIASPLRYFEDKVAGRNNPGATPGGPLRPMGHMEHRVQGRWQAAWSAPLVNEDCPVNAIVSPQGVVATFDNWHSAGYGPDVIVIYDSAGRKVRALALDDILPEVYVRALPRSVSSIWWGGGHGFSPDGQQLILRVVVPRKEEFWNSKVAPDLVEIRLETATGRVVPPEGEAWDRALAAARVVSAERAALQARQIEEFKAPLAAPATGDAKAWRKYLVEAYFRVTSDADPAFPTTAFVAAGRPDDEARDQQQVRQLLKRAQDDQDLVAVLGSPDPARLIRILAKVIAEPPPHALRQAIYVTVTPALRDAAARAIAPSGATFVALDISAPIPQSPQRLERMQETMAEAR